MRTAAAGATMLVVATVLVAGPPANAAVPGHVQSTAKQITSGTVNSVAFASPNTAGNLIVAYVLWNNAGSVTLTDSRNAYSAVAPVTRFANSQWSSQVFYAKNVGAGANTVKATFVTAVSGWAMVYVHEYSGLDKVNPLDGFNAATGSTSAMTSGPVTTTAGGLLFASGASNSTVTAAGPGYTTRSTLSGDRTMDSVAASTGTHNATATQNGNVWVLHLVAFKAAGGASTSPTPSPSGSTPPPSGFAYEKVIVDPVAEDQPWMKAIGDLNGDGIADLIVSGRDGRVVWYQTPQWTERVIAQTASSQSGSAAADIDSDGDIDVVVGTTWYENVEHATLWTARNLPGGSSNMTHDIVIADVDNDGQQDISMRGESSSPVNVFLQGAVASFTKFTLDPGIGLNGLDVADVNADGRRDIVVGGRWMQNPGGTVASTPWQVHTFGHWLGYAAVKVTNLNGGPVDIVLSASEENGKLSWFEQLANGSWTEHVIEPSLASVHGFIVADLDRDGLLDLTTSEYRGQGRLTIYRQVRDGGGVITWQANQLGTDLLHNIQAADLNGDCKLDFFGAYSLSASTPVVLYRSTGATAC